MLNGIDSEFSPLKQFYTNFLKTFSNDDLEFFKSLTSDEERIQFVYDLPSLEGFEISENKTLKSSDLAKKLKEDGNKAFQVDQFKVALALYSKAIIKQPQNSSNEKEELSVLFANRSAALYHIKEYDAALQDIKSALENNYPLNLQYKICDRKARCFLALNQLKSAQDSFRETIQALDNAKLNSEKKQKWQRDIQIMLAMLDKNKDLKNVPRTSAKDYTSQFKDGVNKQYPSASSVVTIREDPQMGRFAEAKIDIKPGDLLVKEKPHCAVLLDQYTSTHCFECFRRAKAPVPCPTCSNVLFCSKPCLQSALQTHHAAECSILPALWQSGASVTVLMALRIITQRQLEHFLQLRPSLEKSIKDKPYKSDDYRRVYNLVNHGSDRSAEDFLHRTVVAVFLLRCLKTTDYFKMQDENTITTNEKMLSENEKFIGGLILRHIQSLQFNSHEVSELVIDGKNKKSVFIGGAVYPTLALFNHSCNPGIVRYQKGTEVIARAIRTIRSGEMVAENYGPIFTQEGRESRQSKLRNQYWFDCQCEACLEDWPTLDNMSSDVMRFRCDCGNTLLVPVNTPEFMIPCHSCNQHANIFKGLKVLQDTDMMFRVAKSLVDEGNFVSGVQKFVELLTMLDSVLVPPFQDYHICQQEIRTCMLTCGNVHKEK
ncbi:SET and MYND domain-containing protein 4 [Macrosteles quadrilineatus]|uniref:SET and MYND domain-containing protein 4 n=1 Tax=Macrosteles quadrilineatus TaxID=74068 RepID=UPI0023E2DF61|nr:SET and MYND domain-containing protein 4 [Macrosteles quadrilineatus]